MKQTNSKWSAGIAALAIASMLEASPALAQGSADAVPGRDEDYHAQLDSDIVVSAALPVARLDVLSGVAVLQGAELESSLRSSIGETLAGIPGVSATSFGPNASRPILRGLQGERVRILSNGTGSIDVSNTSVDHAAVVNPLLAQRIEVLRGPQSLLYGSSAMGGVVNVIDGRIPLAVPDEPVHVAVQAGYGSAASERSIAGALDAPLGGGWVFHADGSFSESDDLRIGGFALTPALCDESIASSLLPPDPDSEIDFAANAQVRDRLPNTAGRTWTAGAGVAHIGDWGNVGVAYSHTGSLYGVPIRFATLPGQGQEGPRISLRQDRIDARAEVNAGGALIDKLALRFGYADYEHAELAEDGSIGTAFFNKGLEGRLELTQAKRGNWQGVTGAQFSARNFDAIGEEAFLPRSRSRQFGLFTVQQIDTGPLRIEAGARYEHNSLTALPDSAQVQFISGNRSFDTFSASVGASHDFATGWKLGLNLSRTARAPSAEELFASGPHAGTQAFELGDPGLRPERAWGIEGILRGNGENFSFEASAYYNWFSNFIYEDRTGDEEDGLPVYQIRQADARYYGFEVQGSLVLARSGSWKLTANALADYVHATIHGSGPAPRIPPLRLMGGLSATSPRLDFHLEVERVTAQNRVAALETSTPGYTMANFEIAWRPWGKERPLSLTLSANNIFDVIARRHASFLKDYAPLTGRDIRITARFEM
ncbi:MAG: TonB-dependent receptor [Novosphingobium sp.]